MAYNVIQRRFSDMLQNVRKPLDNLALSAKIRKAALRASAGLFWYAADGELAHRTMYDKTARATVRSWAAFHSLHAPLEGLRDSDGRLPK